MTTEDALRTICQFETAEYTALLEAMNYLESIRLTLNDSDRWTAYASLALAAWSDRFLIHMPHDGNNPGLRAYDLLPSFWDEHQSTFAVIHHRWVIEAYLERHS